MYSETKLQRNSFVISGFIYLGSVVISAIFSMIFLYILFYGEYSLKLLLQEIQTLLVISAILLIAFLIFYILGMQNLKSRKDLVDSSEISIISITASVLIFTVLLATIASILVFYLPTASWLSIVLGVLSILHGLTTFPFYYFSWKLFRKIIKHEYLKKLNISFLFVGILLSISYIFMSVSYFNTLAFVPISPLSIFLSSVGGLFSIIVAVALILNNGELKQEISRIKEV